MLRTRRPTEANRYSAWIQGLFTDSRKRHGCSLFYEQHPSLHFFLCVSLTLFPCSQRAEQLRCAPAPRLSYSWHSKPLLLAWSLVYIIVCLILREKKTWLGQRWITLLLGKHLPSALASREEAQCELCRPLDLALLPSVLKCFVRLS